MEPRYHKAEGDLASLKSLYQGVLPPSEWMADTNGRSSLYSFSTTSSRLGSYRPDDMDLDSLFKQLDRYTTEMEEVEARLKRARSNSEKSDDVFALDRPSFDPSGGVSGLHAPAPVEVLPLTTPSSSPVREKRWSRIARLLEEWPGANSPENRSEGVPASQQLLGSVQPVGMVIETDQRPFEDLKQQWAERPFTSPQRNPSRRRSRHSDRPISVRESSERKLVSKRQSPSLPSKQSLLESGREDLSSQSRKRNSEHHVKEEREDQYELSEDDEPALPAPHSWTLPPRTSSRTMPREESEARRETDRPLSVPTHRRPMTSEGRSSVRNGGFWSGHAAGLLSQENLPPVPALSPALSQSPSAATPKSSPPSTPLTLYSPREDSMHRGIGIFASHGGSEVLEPRYKRRGRATMPGVLDVEDESGYLLPFSGQKGRGRPLPQAVGQDIGGPFASSRPRRRKSIFSIFQRRSDVEKLIDLYFEQDEDEDPASKRASIWSRKHSPPQVSNHPRSPPVPRLPPAFHGKQTSI